MLTSQLPFFRDEHPSEELTLWELKEHGLNFCSHLRSSFGGPLFLKPTPLAEGGLGIGELRVDASDVLGSCDVSGVQQKFLTATEELEGKLIPTYHGTSEHNFPSIFQRGLLHLGTKLNDSGTEQNTLEKDPRGGIDSCDPNKKKGSAKK